jgi:hypothetical protein
MIVKCIKKREDNYEKELVIGKLYCVISLTFYYDGKIDYNILVEKEDLYGGIMFPSDNFEIVDGTLPNTWILADWKDWQRWHLGSFAYSNLKGDDIYESDNMGFINMANEILAFHNWPLLEIPEDLLPEPTYEERRKKAMNDELEEYLRIAEEDEKK